jgi:hypothetical protein
MCARASDYADLRTDIDLCFRTDVDLDAFIIDYFPNVAHQISCSMERKRKVNILFLSVECQSIKSALGRSKRRIIPSVIEKTLRQLEPSFSLKLADKGIDELVAVLNYRLIKFYQRIVILNLSQEAQEKVRLLLGRLGQLHGEYEKALREGHLVLAHELCCELGTITVQVENQVGKPARYLRYFSVQSFSSIALAA